MREQHPNVWRAIITIVVVLVLVAGLLSAIMLGQRTMLYFPDTSNPRTVDGADDVSFTTADGLMLRTWLFTPTVESRNVAVLFFPGNGGNRAGRASVAREIAALGYTVLLLEYRGYGGNPGKPTEEGLALDAQAAAQCLHDLGFPAGRIIYVGESLGTGVATRLATTDQPVAVLLRSPFTSMVDMAKALYPFLPADLLLRDRYETIVRLPMITVPVTVLAGSADELVPVSQSATVADTAPNLFRFDVVDGAGHNDPLWGSAYVAEQVDALAEAAIK